MPEDNKQNPLKQDLRHHGQDRLSQYRTQEGDVRSFLKVNLAYPVQKRKQDELEVREKIKELTSYALELIPYIRSARSYTDKVLDENKWAAIYMLFGRIHQSIQAILYLAGEGFFCQVMELIRSNREAMDLVSKFLIENDDDELTRWFHGNIIKNEGARITMETFVNKNGEKVGVKIPISRMKAGIYHGFSLYTHSSYYALLELYNVFKMDFDFEKDAGFHHLNETGLKSTSGMKLMVLQYCLNIFSLPGAIM